MGIRLHLTGLSLSNTERDLEKLGVQRSPAAIHNGVQKAELQSTSDVVTNQIAVDETVIRVNGEQCWLNDVVNPAMNEFLHVRLFQTLTTPFTLLFLSELCEKQQVE